METACNQFRYIDLTTLDAPGRRKLIVFYRKLLEDFPGKKKTKKAPDFAKRIKRLSAINNEKNICVDENIDISGLTDEMYDTIL